MNKACSNLKVGVSSIDCVTFIKRDFLDNSQNKFTLLVTGSYDYRIRFYNINSNDNNLDISYLGLTNIKNGGIIHQCKLIEDKETNALYLLVVSDQKLFYVYQVA